MKIKRASYFKRLKNFKKTALKHLNKDRSNLIKKVSIIFYFLIKLTQN